MKRIRSFVTALCLCVLMAAPAAVYAEEGTPAAGPSGESVSGNSAGEPFPVGGLLHVAKTDGETGEPLPGASFKVYHAADGTEAGEIVTGADGTGEVSLMPGEYYLLEQEAPEGYELSGERIAAVVADGGTEHLAITNRRIPEPEPENGTVHITVTDADDLEKKLSGAVFAFYESGSGKKAGEAMTGKDGTASLELPAGSYTGKEMTAPDGYALSTDPIELSLEAGGVKELTVRNRKADADKKAPGALRITKRDSESGNRLSGAIFGIYGKGTDNRMGEITTDRKGVAEIELEAGSYYLLELEAPQGYRLDEERIGFQVQPGKTTEKTIKNTKEETDSGEKQEDQAGTAEKTDPLSGLTSALSGMMGGGSLTGSGSTFSDGLSSGGDTGGKSQGAGTAEKNGTLQVLNAASGTGEKLSGQVLAVYNSEDKKVGEVKVKDGKGTLSLPEGDYYLRERKSPAGFFGETARIRFTISKGMATVVEITSERDMEHTDPQDLIPKTGEPLPLLPFGLSALCFLAAALCGLSLTHMKQKQH